MHSTSDTVGAVGGFARRRGRPSLVRQCACAGAAALVMVGAMVEPLPAQQRDGPPDDAGRAPAGTRFSARLEGAIDAADSRVGDRFTARVTNPSRAATRDGPVPDGAVVTGTIAAIQRTHGTLAPAFVRLTIESLAYGGQVHPMRAVVESADLPAQSGKREESTPRGQSFPGVARGSVLVGVNAGGATVGTLVSLGTDDAALRLPAGTLLTLRVH